MKIKDIKNKLEKGKRPKMAILYPAGKNQKALEDFENHRFFGSVKDRFNIKLVKCPITNKERLIEATRYRNVRNADILVIIRGGGEGLEVFNDKEVVRAFARLYEKYNTIICVGIGHSADRPAIYDIASLGATTPTELSVFFKDLVSKDWEEISETWSKCAQTPENIKRKIRKLLADECQYSLNSEINETEEIKGENQKMNKWRVFTFLLGVVLFFMGTNSNNFDEIHTIAAVIGSFIIIYFVCAFVLTPFMGKRNNQRANNPNQGTSNSNKEVDWFWESDTVQNPKFSNLSENLYYHNMWDD